MKPKLLTKRQQMGIFNTQNPIEVMREYVSFSEDMMKAAPRRYYTSNLEEIQASKEPMSERQIQIFKNLSSAEAREIAWEIKGHIYPKVLVKMLDVFPKPVSKELLIGYGTYCSLSDEVLEKALDVLGKEAKEVLLTLKDHEVLCIGVFNAMLRVFSKAEAKDILLEMASDANFMLSEDVELKILRVFSNAELKELLKGFAANISSLEEESFLKVFEVCDNKEEVKEILELAIKGDMDLWYGTLEKIVEYFPKEDAEALLDAFFETSPGCNEYSDEDVEKLYAALK